MRSLAVLTVRNEAAFLLEWLAHHRACGFTGFLVFSNDCQDGTDAMLDRLQAMGWLTHCRNDGPYDERGIQFTALNGAARLEPVRKADWIAVLDIDEFVNIHAGDRTLPALLGALPGATAITLTWRLFGNDGIAAHEDMPVTDRFTACAPSVIHWPWRAAMFKTLYRNDGTYRKLGVHRPRSPDPDRVAQARWFDGAGRRLGPGFARQRVYSDYGQDNFALVQLNHYPLGAMDSYVLKADRGRVNRDGALGMDYWVERNYCSDTDTSIAALRPRRDALLAELRDDPVLGELHRQAVAWRQARFRRLMEDEPNRALYARLLMTPPARPLTPAQARQMIDHARRGMAKAGG
ncbi:glycosyltransferase family 2 protein [Pukyongiella litopenaei]|uniref:Glycosyltransferase family 2 protein n=1 Tax=Pukyongiella litopenaei TaxID=2605946 RepID=A0A2S0MMK5_9RHOB|nr:glycosyltransferase family 2 protein [Pukyongiella litopenaei]AVO37057.1 glycosyltransferase family 2 protein [Pukyongiella litopenaei]